MHMLVPRNRKAQQNTHDAGLDTATGDLQLGRESPPLRAERVMQPSGEGTEQKAKTVVGYKK